MSAHPWGTGSFKEFLVVKLRYVNDEIKEEYELKEWDINVFVDENGWEILQWKFSAKDYIKFAESIFVPSINAVNTSTLDKSKIYCLLIINPTAYEGIRTKICLCNGDSAKMTQLGINLKNVSIFDDLSQYLTCNILHVIIRNCQNVWEKYLKLFELYFDVDAVALVKGDDVLGRLEEGLWTGEICNYLFEKLVWVMKRLCDKIKCNTDKKKKWKNLFISSMLFNYSSIFKIWIWTRELDKQFAYTRNKFVSLLLYASKVLKILSVNIPECLSPYTLRIYGVIIMYCFVWKKYHYNSRYVVYVFNIY